MSKQDAASEYAEWRDIERRLFRAIEDARAERDEARTRYKTDSVGPARVTVDCDDLEHVLRLLRRGAGEDKHPDIPW